MRLTVRGSVHDRGRFANFDPSFDDLSGILHKKSALGVSDTFIVIDEIMENGIRFRVFYFDKETPIELSLGQSQSYSHEGNAFGFRYDFALVE